MPTCKRPTPITDGPQFIRLIGEPARLRIDSPRQRPGDGRAMLEISVEEYEVPEEGGDVVPHGKPDRE